MRFALHIALLLPASAIAAGGSYPGMPDRFWETMGFFVFLALVIALFRKK